ncbi:hypothetical protein GCM10027404_04070 [Arthrobacter tumbae]
MQEQGVVGSLQRVDGVLERARTDDLDAAAVQHFRGSPGPNRCCIVGGERILRSGPGSEGTNQDGDSEEETQGDPAAGPFERGKEGGTHALSIAHYFGTGAPAMSPGGWVSRLRCAAHTGAVHCLAWVSRRGWAPCRS